jgi:hypothetical protein
MIRYDLILQMWLEDPMQRPNFKSILASLQLMGTVDGNDNDDTETSL